MDQKLKCTKSIRKGIRGRGMDWEFEVSRYKLLHLEWISRKKARDGRGVRC